MDRIPYGTAYAFENLNFVFPSADIRTSNHYPDLYNEGDDTTRALIIISREFSPTPDEMKALTQYAASGNQVFISALSFEDTVMKILKLSSGASDFDDGDSTEMSLLDPARHQWVKYEYPGISFNSYFNAIDTGHTMVLGRNFKGKPDFIRISYAHGGAIFIHLNPLAFTNFFLLHKENKSYYDLAFSYLPGKIGVVEWSDYFRYRRQDGNFSALRFILGNRSLRWAFWLTLILFLLMFLVESKRRQRPVPEIASLRNASEDFVKTVGRLYFQQKNNQNLADKMISAFLENIRSAYNLSTSSLNDEFTRKLAFRTGRPLQEVSSMIQSIHEARLNALLSDQELMDLHQKINQFNKPAS
jgi:hypothetical protein